MTVFSKKTLQVITILLVVVLFSVGYVVKAYAAPSVDLVLEPMSYTAPFYKGKPSFASQGTVKIVAIPNAIISGQKVSSQNLIFKWTKDDIVMGDLSGKGKNSITIYGQIPVRDIDISVEVLSSLGEILAENNAFISVGNPKIVFYENSPLLGKLFNKALTNNYFLGDKEEVLITAEPYFFDVQKNTSTELKYSWSVNNGAVSPNGKINELLLRQVNKDTKGTASVNLNIDNNNRLFQYTDNHFNINFGQ
jgi:hypothetical protein